MFAYESIARLCVFAYGLASRLCAKSSESSPTMQLTTASTQALQTTELLEMILIHLSVKDLLFAQSVSKQWKATIDSSSILQKALFFQPTVDGLALFHARLRYYGPENIDPQINGADFLYICGAENIDSVVHYERSRIYYSTPGRLSRLDQIWPSAYKTFPRVDDQARTDFCNAIMKTRVFLNPVLLSKFAWFREFFRDTPTAPDRFCKLDLESGIDLITSAKYPEASWRKMPISQPPLAGLNLFCQQECGPWKKFSSLDAKHAGEPMTMSVLRTILAQWPHKRVRIRATEHFETWESAGDLPKIGTGLQRSSEDEDTKRDGASGTGP